MSYWQQTKLQNGSSVVINPATEDKQTAIQAALALLATAANQTATNAALDLVATKAIQSDGSQKTQIVDSSGNVISSVSNGLSTATKIVDEAGAVYGVKHIMNKPRVSAMPYLYDIAEGNVAGHSPVENIGFTPTLTTTESNIWSAAGVYVYPTSPIQMEVVSSSANDTAAGTGAQTVVIKYLDTNYALQTTTVILNGLTPVDTTPVDILRVNGMYVATAGTGLKAAGNISLRNTAGTVTYAYITAGFTRSRSGLFTVPAGKVVYVTSVKFGYGYAANQTHYARMYLRANQTEGAILSSGIMIPYIETVVANATVAIPLEIPLAFVEKVDIQIAGVATVSGIGFSSIRGWIENA